MFCLLHLLHTHLLAGVIKGTQTHLEGEFKGRCKCVGVCVIPAPPPRRDFLFPLLQATYFKAYSKENKRKGVHLLIQMASL